MKNVLNRLPISSSTDKPDPVYCSHCGVERKQILKEIPLIGERWVVCACSCRIQELKRQEEEQKRVKKQKRIERMMKLSSTNRELRTMTFKNFMQREGGEKAYEEVKDAVKRFEERENLGLMIFGETGNGKTHLTAAGANLLIDQGYSVIFLTEKDLFSRLRETKRFSNHESFTDIMKACLDADLLIWDDFLSSQKFSPEEKDWVFQIVNGRERANRPIWMTSNLSPKEFEDPRTAFRLDEKGRTWWRLIVNMNCMYNKASNYRAVMAMERMKEMNHPKNGKEVEHDSNELST